MKKQLKNINVKMKVVLFLVSFVFLIKPAYAYDPLSFTKFLGFQLDKDTLPDVQKSLGQTPVIRTGDGAATDDSLCYLTKDGSTILNFWSGEMGGDVTLLGFTLYKSDHYQKMKKQSFQLTKSLDKIVIQSLYLGMSKKEFDNIFKAKITSTEPFDTPEMTIKSKSTELVFDGKEKIFDKEEKKMMDYDDMITIEAKFDKDGLYFLSVSQVAQN